MTQCPVCTATQPDGLLCHSCCQKLERALGDVRWIVTELDTAASKQARIGNPSGGGGLARERNPISWGAVEAADVLTNVLAFWVIEVCGEDWPFGPKPSAVTFSRDLLNHVPEIRKHAAVDEILDQITDAVEQARRAVDRPADRMYLGQCATVLPDEDGVDVECYAELWGKPDATEVSCRVCGIEHEVRERREWLMARASDMVVTSREASHYLSDVGALDVSEKSIRNWVARGKVLLRPGLSTQRQFELGALMNYIAKRDADAADKRVAELPIAV